MNRSIDSPAKGYVASKAAAAEDVSRPKLRVSNTICLAAISDDRYERDMVKFVISWRYYGGGPPGQIFEEFGLAEHEFFRRVFLLIKAPTASLALGRPLTQELAQTCLSRLRRCSLRQSMLA
ncbi:MAG: hypothetical protein Q7U75_04200 [Desulfobacterales bacterium]|nr:hypothetical protein [Desulfobacterales bacterium]